MLGFFAEPGEHLVSLEQSLQKRLLAAEAREVIAPAELLHRRAIVENFGQPFGVCAARQSVCAILTDMQRSVVDLQVELRGDLRHGVAGVDRGQHLLGRQKLHGRKKLRGCQRKLQHPVHRRDKRFAGFDQAVVLLLGYEIRPQEWTEKAAASR
jgi:hypothetical protein